VLSTKVKTTSELMSIALQAEREAIRRYSMLAEKMRDGDNTSAAGLFERMVIEEEEHERLLLAWMTQEGIPENSNIGPISWKDPNISTTYDDEARDPYQSSPYRALAFAVHNEEIAFRFYTHVAAESESKMVRKYAEILAREELGHAALLRAERRRAYHLEREDDRVEPRLDPKSIHNKADLLAAAIHIDHFLEEEMNKISENSAEITSLSRETRQQITNNEDVLSNLAMNNNEVPGEAISRNLAQVKSYNDYMGENANNQSLRVQRLCACCDRSFAFYDAVVDATNDEAVMLTAQKLSSLALDRIGILKETLGKECGCAE
jgi:rubrerythrin